MQHLKVRKIGNSLGVVLPREVLARLGVGEGDELIVTSTPDGQMRLVRGDAALARQLEAARKGMVRYRKALRELAK